MAVVSRSCDELPGAWLVECLGEQVGEVVDDDALGLELCDERVVLLAGPVRPHDVVEEQLVDVVRG